MKKDKIFLINKFKINEICKNIKKGKNLLEIGPGYGSLTKKIIKKFKFNILVEKEKKFCIFLKKKYKKNVKVINKDILNYKIIFKTTIVGNIPYSISNKILIKLIKEKKKIKEAYIMLQKDLFEALYKRKKLSSFLLLFNFDVSKISELSGNDFYPSVSVNSIFFSMKPKKNYLSKKIDIFLIKNCSFLLKNKKIMLDNSKLFKCFRKTENSKISINENFFFLLYIYKKFF
ncbi:rRNA adenine N-6-methyltransferase family protein [Candidatus Vidania fulgoroideorum]